jgi:hypothetical protein
MWVLQIGHPEKRIVEGMTHFYDANVAGMMKMRDSMKVTDAMKATDKLMKAH